MFSQPSSWRPNAPESQLFDEKTWFQGAIVSAVTYGVNLALFVLNISLLRTRAKLEIKQESRRSRQTLCLLVYVCVVFVLSTLTMASESETVQLGFIDDRNFPGGPAAYEELQFSSPIGSLGNYCVSLMNWVSDGLLLWRCLVIYTNSSVSIWLIMTLPGFLMLASFATGIIYLHKVSQPSSSPWTMTTFTLLYGIIGLSLNIVLTLMIVIRLYLYRRYIINALGPRHAVHYTSIIAILVESAVLMDVMYLFFLVPFAMGNPLANIPMASMVQIETTASYMIIFRVARGSAWTSETMVSGSTIHGRPTSMIRFQAPQSNTDSLEVLSSRQFPLDEPRDLSDTESNSRGFRESST